MELISGGSGPIISSGANNVRQFKMRACAKAFDAQIAGLYSDKIKAVIRELSTNAYEAHQLLRIEDKPFSVKLPSTYDSILKIRDFGPGISDEDIGEIYITLYESTKEHSNEFGGAFGLGSKSPYAYTSNFSVTSIHKGLKTIYALSRDANGIPCISTLMSSKTTEPSGIEIEIPVNKYDISRFVEAAQNVYKWFKTKPTITGNNLYVEKPIGKTVLSGTNWCLTDSNEQSVAVMGNIAYPLTGYTGNNSDICYKKGLVLYFDIGQLEPTPSRESLSFNTETLEAISKRFKTIIDEYSVIVQKEIDKEVTTWDAMIKCSELSRGAIFSFNRVYKGNPIDNKVSLHSDPKLWNSPSLVPSFQETNYYGSKFVNTTSIVPSKNVKFLINDKPSYAKMRIKNFKDSSYGTKVYLLDEADLVALKAKIDCDDSYFIKLSDLPKPVVNRTSSSKKSKVLKYNSRGQYNNACWDEAEIDDTTEGYYVDIKNNKMIFNGVEYSPVDFSYLYHYIKDSLGTDLNLYGIKTKGSSEELEPVIDLIEKYYDEIKDIQSNYTGAIDSWNSVSQYRILNFLDNDTLDSIQNDDLIEVRKEFLKTKEAKQTGVNSYVTQFIDTLFPNKIHKPKTTSYKLDVLIEAFIKKYPLVPYISQYSVSSDFANELNYYFLGRNQ